MNDNLIEVGEYNPKFNEILGIDYKDFKIYRSKGLPKHMVKKKHFDALKYIDYVSDIISEPTYIGINPNEKDSSIELVKVYDKNVLVGIKLDEGNEYFYVSSIYIVQDNKISNRLNSGRIKQVC